MRYYGFTKALSWELLILFSLSSSFRNAATDLPETEWKDLLDIVSQNRGSFVLISKTIRPQYGALLVGMFRVLGIVENIVDNPSDAWMAMNNYIYAAASADRGCFKNEGLGTEELEGPESERYLNHPQRWFVAIDRQSIFPVDPVYVPIVESRVYAQDFPNESDPRYIGGECEGFGKLESERKKVCERCEAKCLMACSCTFVGVFPEPLVEIIETDGKGLGVRSLQVLILLGVLRILADVLM